MNKTFQSVFICGRLTKDPEIKKTNSGVKVLNFNLIVEEDNGKPNLIPCVAWEKKAQLIEDNAKKGSLIQFDAKIKSSSFKDAEDRKQLNIQCELLTYGKLLFFDQKNTDETKVNSEV